MSGLLLQTTCSHDDYDYYDEDVVSVVEEGCLELWLASASTLSTSVYVNVDPPLFVGGICKGN